MEIAVAVVPVCLGCGVVFCDIVVAVGGGGVGGASAGADGCGNGSGIIAVQLVGRSSILYCRK